MLLRLVSVQQKEFDRDCSFAWDDCLFGLGVCGVLQLPQETTLLILLVPKNVQNQMCFHAPPLYTVNFLVCPVQVFCLVQPSETWRHLRGEQRALNPSLRVIGAESLTTVTIYFCQNFWWSSLSTNRAMITHEFRSRDDLVS